MAELDVKRAGLETQASELEKRAGPLREDGAEGDRKSFLLSQARVLREDARDLARKWADLAEEDRS